MADRVEEYGCLLGKDLPGFVGLETACSSIPFTAEQVIKLPVSG